MTDLPLRLKRIDPDTKSRVITDFLGGMTYEDIMKRNKVKYQQIQYILRQARKKYQIAEYTYRKKNKTDNINKKNTLPWS